MDDLARLAALLTTARLGRTHEHHSELGSTNDRALEWLAAPSGAPDGALITADTQSAGRGRLGRVWSSPPSRDVYASVVVRCGRPSAGIGALSLAVGVGLREGLLRAVPALDPTRLTLKWPNDVLLDERKLAGILCESRWRGGEVDVIVGFGINVHRQTNEFEPELRGRATSLAIELGEAPARAAVLAAVLHQLERTLDRFFVGGFGVIRSQYESHAVVIGREIKVDQPGRESMLAVALGLDPDGALRVRTQHGTEIRIDSADVWLA